MTDPINQEHEDVLNFAHSLPSGLTKEQIYVRIHERAAKEAAARVDAAIAAHNEAVSEQERISAELSSCRAAAAAGLPAGWEAMPVKLNKEMRDVLKQAAPRWNAESVWSNLLAAAPALPADPVDESQPAAQWISVDRLLPGQQGQDSEEVLCFLNGHCSIHDMECRRGGGWGIRLGYYDADIGMFRTGGCKDDSVTHWMPLPSAPAMEAQSHE